jgi:hypothetical protein
MERAEVWTDLRCNGGVRVAVLPLISCTTTEEIVGGLVSRQLRAQVPMGWIDSDELVVRRIICLVFDTTDTLWTEYRITSIEDSLGEDGQYTILARGIEYDLGECNVVISATAGTLLSFAPLGTAKTPTQHITDYLDASLPSYWGTGIVTPTTAVDVQYGEDTPLSAGLKIAAAANAAEPSTYGTDFVISARAVGSSAYVVDLTEYNVSALIPALLQGKNLTGIRRVRKTDQETTRVVVHDGDLSGLRRPHYVITTVSAGAYIEVSDLRGGRGPAREDDQFNTTGNYWIELKNGTGHQITDTTQVSATVTRFAMTSTTGMVAGEWGYLAMNSTGDDLAYVDSPSLQTAWGIKVGVLDGVPHQTNLLANPDLRDWPGTLPTGWVRAVGASADPVKETTVGKWRYGGVSAKHAFTVSNIGIEQTITVYCPAGWTVLYWVGVYIDVLPATLQNFITCKQAEAAGNDNLLQIDPAVDLVGSYKIATKSYTMATSAAKTLRLRSLATAAMTVDWDAGQIFLLPPGFAVPSTFSRGSGAALNLTMANAHLTTNGEPPVSYEVRVLDLFRVDPLVAGLYEELALGARVNIIATTLGIPIGELQRTQRVQTNQLLAHDTVLSLATARPQLTQIIAGGI